MRINTNSQITRRGALAGGAGAVLLGNTAAGATKKKTVSIGLATTQFQKHTNAALAKEFRAAGVRVIQLFFTQTDSNYWRYNTRSDLVGMTPERAKEIAGIWRGEGIAIQALGVYANLIHPDEAERKANFAYFDAMMKVGGHMGVNKFISEAGHYRVAGAEAGAPYHWREDVWNRMVGTGKELARAAEGYGATVLLEPYFEGFLATAKRTRMFIEEVGSPRLRVNLDPANLIEVNDLGEMFDQLGPMIEAFHAKDRKLHVIRGVAAGAGSLDYKKFVTLATERRPGVPLVLEYVGGDTYQAALAHLRRVIQECGLKEG
jgi:sugar phosphate isomerase/epimerase